MDNNGENLKKVYELMDCSQLETQIGEKMFEIFKSQSVEKTVFEDFTTLDLYEVINHVIRRI